MLLRAAAIAAARAGVGTRGAGSYRFRAHAPVFDMPSPILRDVRLNGEASTGWTWFRHQRHFSGNHVLQQAKSGSNAGAATKQKKGGFVGWYLSMLEKRPVVTKSVTACTIYTTADLIAQKLTAMKLGGKAEWDSTRTLRMAAVGLFMSGPTLHLWFNFLSKVLPGRDIVSTLKKMLLGQMTYGPAFTATFFSINAVAQGETGEEIWQRLKRDLIPTLASGLMYWPFCDFFTFRIVPVHLQPLVSNSFSLVWTVYLTYMASLKK